MEIFLNVFDMNSLNTAIRAIGLGFYHTSIMIGNNVEVYYSFFGYGEKGVEEAELLFHPPKGTMFTLYKTISLGNTSLSIDECNDLLTEFKQKEEWQSDYYNCIYHNCNDFTFELAKAFLGEDVKYPMWVMRLPKIAKFIFSISFDHLIGLIDGLPPCNNPYVKAKQPIQNKESTGIEETP